MGSGNSKELAQQQDSQDIDLSNKSLKSLPPGLKKSKNLVNLNISNNNLTSFGVDLGKFYIAFFYLIDIILLLGKLSALRSIDLSHNEYNGFPEEICKLKQLNTILISYNRLFLTPIPADICNLSNLLRLDLGNNQLE